MIQSLTSGVSGMQQFQQEMDVIGNNIANVNTAGFKGSRVDFADSFSQTLLTATGTVSGIQVGTGVNTAAVSTDFTGGTLETTDVPSNLGIQGNGFFVVRDPVSNVDYVTRSGQFKVDNNGYLVTPDGFRVQGYSDTTLTTIGDLKIDNTNDGTTPHAFVDAANTKPAQMTDYSIDTSGQIHVVLEGGAGSYVRGQVLLQNFVNPQALVKEGNSLYSGMTNAGPIGGTTPKPAVAGTNGLGYIQSSKLEASNVDLTSQMSDLITAQRAFQANARIIVTSDETLQDIVNLKR